MFFLKYPLQMGYELEGNDIKEFIEFSAQNRMSGVDLQDNTKIRKGLLML